MKKVIGDNAGLETSRLAGAAMDDGDKAGPGAAGNAGNNRILLDAAETQRRMDASANVEGEWGAEMRR
ncbi:hypothetical protein [Breoghania sp. L-A4]|uniref:hypothetical protein n=1 Tax=Breoghania sp. L-A4 TaxID=2304600 RepID=UPI000E35A7D9|nr:hypothetical protein [Breoghania sp. L-A4]AXS40338.1 hypothetical protein D1F64_10065 [Breoghania sp. L-A4]